MIVYNTRPVRRQGQQTERRKHLQLPLRGLLGPNLPPCCNDWPAAPRSLCFCQDNVAQPADSRECCLLAMSSSAYLQDLCKAAHVA